MTELTIIKSNFVWPWDHALRNKERSQNKERLLKSHIKQATVFPFNSIICVLIRNYSHRMFLDVGKSGS